MSELRLTQTIPGPGAPCDEGEEAVALAGDAGTGWLGAAGLG